MDARKQTEWLVKNCAEPFKDGLNKGMKDAGRWGAQLIHGGFFSDSPHFIKINRRSNMDKTERMIDQATVLKLLFETMRIIPIKINRALTDDSMVEALTLNENIKSVYGYTFKPDDLVMIAKSNTDVWSIIKRVMPEVKGMPMYPDFPSQVMDMDEATYRFHQAKHYFSTYGIEDLFGGEVERGWLPNAEETEKVKEDKGLIDIRVIGVVVEKELPLFVVRELVQRKHRLTDAEKELLKHYISSVEKPDLCKLQVSFKENLLDVFCGVIEGFDRCKAIEILSVLCQHTGDVLKCIRYYHAVKRRKLSTSKKRTCVRLLEAYGDIDFCRNIMRSKSDRENVLITLRAIDYNRFSKSVKHKYAVSYLRDRRLMSWYGMIENTADTKKLLELLGKRPGELLRRVNQLLNKGVNREEIIATLKPKVNQLSLATLVQTNTFFNSNFADKRFSINKFELQSIFKTLLYLRMKELDTPLKNKRIYIDDGAFSFEQSILEVNNKSQIGGYVQSGLAYKIPDEARVVRFYVYWDDRKRVDIDLHAKAVTGDICSHIGWNSDFRNGGIVMSGDVTHSNAAEYIDIDLNQCTADYVILQIHDYTGYGFNNILTVLCGCMVVSGLGRQKDYKLYTPKNSCFSTEIKSESINLNYAYVDVKNKVMRFIGKEGKIRSVANKADDIMTSKFSLHSYLETLMYAQNATHVEAREQADIVLRIDKGEAGEISLIDVDFFLNA